jgi:hypothetical protein
VVDSTAACFLTATIPTDDAVLIRHGARACEVAVGEQASASITFACQ